MADCEECEECEDEKRTDVSPSLDDRVDALEQRMARVETAIQAAYARVYKYALALRNGALIALWAVFCVLLWVL